MTCKLIVIRKKSILASIFVLMFSTMFFRCDPDRVVVKKLPGNRWPEVIEISNQTVRLSVIPAIGRIMHYGFHGGENILWVNEQWAGKLPPADGYYQSNDSLIWLNYGGDKVWPTPQLDFLRLNGTLWPPDPWFDGGWHQFELLKDGVRLTCRISPFCGARLIREIHLADDGTRVTIYQTLEKVQVATDSTVEPINFTIWSLTQIRPPEQIIFQLHPQSQFSNGFFIFPDYPDAKNKFFIDENYGVFFPDTQLNQKAGTDAENWIAAIVDSLVMVEIFQRNYQATYPDGNLTNTAFTCPTYTELELLSPLAQLKIGEKISYTIAWELNKIPAGLKTSKEKRDWAFNWLEKQTLD